MTEIGPNGLTENVRNEIRKEASQLAAKWVVGGIVALLLIAATGWWLYLKPKLQIIFGVPAGAVVAFDIREGCPDGWEPFDQAVGRTIVGSAIPGRSIQNRDESNLEIPPPEFGTPGGRLNNTLAAANLPPLNVDIYYRWSNVSASNGGFPLVRSFGQTGADGGGVYSANTGGTAVPITNMMPYLPLMYCKRLS